MSFSFKDVLFLFFEILGSLKSMRKNTSIFLIWACYQKRKFPIPTKGTLLVSSLLFSGEFLNSWVLIVSKKNQLLFLITFSSSFFFENFLPSFRLMLCFLLNKSNLYRVQVKGLRRYSPNILNKRNCLQLLGLLS